MSRPVAPKAPPMYLDLIIAGFGGQGILLMGNLLACAAMEAGLHSTFIPVYGAEMRGGTANCTVVLSDAEIGSPLIRRPHSLVIMNRPSYEKFVPLIQTGGICVVNTNLVEAPPPPPAGTRIVGVQANALAEQAGNNRLANMVALGAYIAATGVVPLELVASTLPQVLSAHYQHLLAINTTALNLGHAAAQKVLEATTA